jgi:hypothetical protein
MRNIKNNMAEPCVTASFNEYPISTESITVIRQTNAIAAVIDRKESMSKDIPERINPIDSWLNLVRKFKLLLTFFPLTKP